MEIALILIQNTSIQNINCHLPGLRYIILETETNLSNANDNLRSTIVLKH